jgi:hypothetical protein
MNSDVEMQTKSNIPRKINLINNQFEALNCVNNLLHWTKSTFSDVTPQRRPIPLGFAACPCRSQYWLSAPAVVPNENAIELTVATYGTLASVRICRKKKEKKPHKSKNHLSSCKGRKEEKSPF